LCSNSSQITHTISLHSSLSQSSWSVFYRAELSQRIYPQLYHNTGLAQNFSEASEWTTIFMYILYHTMKGHAQESCKVYISFKISLHNLLILYSIFSSSFKQDTYPCVFQNFEHICHKVNGIVEYFLQFQNHFMGYDHSPY